MEIFNYGILTTSNRVYETPNATMVVVFVEVASDTIPEQISTFITRIHTSENTEEVTVTAFQPSRM